VKCKSFLEKQAEGQKNVLTFSKEILYYEKIDIHLSPPNPSSPPHQEKQSMDTIHVPQEVVDLERFIKDPDVSHEYKNRKLRPRHAEACKAAGLDPVKRLREA
jgi:hypothetical protein